MKSWNEWWREVINNGFYSENLNILTIQSHPELGYNMKNLIKKKFDEKITIENNDIDKSEFMEKIKESREIFGIIIFSFFMS